MRYLAVLLLAFLIATGRAQSTQDGSRATGQNRAHAPELRKASLDSVVQFLITSCATDFRTHHPAGPVRFLKARVGHMPGPNGKAVYMLCGQFRQAQGGDSAESTPFVTIKTSGYEQYIGNQTTNWCKNRSVTWDTTKDLASSLQHLYDSLR